MTTTMAEPEWDADTRQLVLAHADAPMCPICGRPTEVCQASDAVFEAELPTRCHAATAIYRAQESDDYEQPQALIWSARERGTGG